MMAERLKLPFGASTAFEIAVLAGTLLIGFEGLRRSDEELRRDIARLEKRMDRDEEAYVIQKIQGAELQHVADEVKKMNARIDEMTKTVRGFH